MAFRAHVLVRIKHWVAPWLTWLRLRPPGPPSLLPSAQLPIIIVRTIRPLLSLTPSISETPSNPARISSISTCRRSILPIRLQYHQYLHPVRRQAVPPAPHRSRRLGCLASLKLTLQSACSTLPYPEPHLLPLNPTTRFILGQQHVEPRVLWPAATAKVCHPVLFAAQAVAWPWQTVTPLCAADSDHHQEK